MFSQAAATSSLYNFQVQNDPTADSEPLSRDSSRTSSPDNQPDGPAPNEGEWPLAAPVVVASAAEEPAHRYGSTTSLGIGLYLISIGVLAVLIVTVFFGIGFLLLVSPAVGTMSASSTPSDPEVRLPAEALSSLSDSNHRPAISPLQSSTEPRAAAENSAALPAMLGPSISATGVSRASARTDALTEITRSSSEVPPSATGPTTLAVTVHAPPSFALSTSEITGLLEHGDALLRTGDIASARLFYERVAAAGEGHAALRLGATYDPAFLNRAGLGNMQADPAQARSWYSRALELGEPEAKKLLGGVEAKHGD